jgi:ubiquinone/menaquinone biosynthesis C-methylase UbiE
MELNRRPFQGVLNILYFNWHFYVVAGVVIVAALFVRHFLPETIRPLAFWGALLAFLTLAVSLLVSFYIYDLSDLYQLRWLPSVDNKRILNINAGFDETSALIRQKHPTTNLTICDFYNPNTHTEVSVKRARRAYPPLANTIQVATDELPFPDHSFDYALAILSAHEIRDEGERIRFFQELHRVTKPTGQIFVTEHLRDLNNFMAYTIGFFHFHAKSSWLRTFEQANLTLKQEIKITPFISTFILNKNGDTL